MKSINKKFSKIRMETPLLLAGVWILRKKACPHPQQLERFLKKRQAEH
jgi:hypothetical protein